jgi:hypothetical protein
VIGWLLATTTDDLLVVTIPSVIGACIAGGCSIYAAKIGLENRRSLHEVKRKVTSPGRGTLGEQSAALVEQTGATLPPPRPQPDSTRSIP